MSVSIAFQNWNILVGPTILGQQLDQNCQTVTVTGDIPSGWDWYLLLGLGDQYNAYLMSQEDGILSVVLDETAMPQSGPYQLQLKGIQLENPSVIKHTNTTTVLVEPSISGNGSWPGNLSEFSQIEERIQSHAALIAQQVNTVAALEQQTEALTARTQDAAQSALENASRVQSALEQIYTKQESNDQFARALVAETEIETFHEIYPDPDSNLIVTTYGYTEQEGIGDPSPENIRPIHTGGVQLVEYTLTGEEHMNTASLTDGSWYVQVTLPSSLPFAIGGVSRIYCNIANWNYSIVDTVVYMNPNSRTLVFGSGFMSQYASLEEFQAMIQSRFQAETPVKIWYAPMDASLVTGLYTSITLNGGWSHYNATCLQLSEPLCEGDYIISNHDGTCLEIHIKGCLIFSGQEQWGFAGSDPLGHTLVLLPEGKVPGVDFGTVVCSHGKLSTTLNPGGLYIAGNNLLINPTGGQFGAVLDAYPGSLTEKWKAYLRKQYSTGTPVTLIYTRKESVIYTHPSPALISQPDQTGKVLVSSERASSIKYNKSLARAILELQTATFSEHASS